MSSDLGDGQGIPMWVRLRQLVLESRREREYSPREARKNVLLGLSMPMLVARWKELNPHTTTVISNPALWDPEALVEEILLVEFDKEGRDKRGS